MGRTSPLATVHDESGARVTEFGGWTMPVRYETVRAEHTAVRETVGKFDVSHMSQVRVSGPDATALVQRLQTADATALAPGDACYGAFTDTRGVLVDDVVVYRLPDTGGDLDPDYLIVANAGHDEEATARAERVRDDTGLTSTVENETASWAMVAVQGPDALALADAATDGAAITELDRFEATSATVDGVDCWVATTGYTGEAGVEVLCPWEDAEVVWTAFDCQPCGLGARDTLRLEMGYLLSGQEFDPETERRTPFEAGIDFAVDLDTPFVGRDALVGATDPDDRLVGLRLTERAVPRHGYPVLAADGETEVGHVTSGTLSPTLEEPIALAYLPRAYRDPGTTVAVEVRGEPVSARVDTPPFVDT